MLTLCSFYIFKLYFQLTVECSLQFYTIICNEFVMFCVDLWYFYFFGDILYVLCHIYDQHNCKYWIYVYLYVVWHWLIKNWIELPDIMNLQSLKCNMFYITESIAVGDLVRFKSDNIANLSLFLRLSWVTSYNEPSIFKMQCVLYDGKHCCRRLGSV